MSVPERKQTVLKLLEQLRGLDALKELFWTELNYERENKQRRCEAAGSVMKHVYLPLRIFNLLNTAERAKHDAIVELVTSILATKAINPSADTSALEQEIARLLYVLYRLTKEKIAIIEGRE